MPEQDRTPRPRRWWQWILLYPALFIAVLANVPQIYQLIIAVRKDVPFSEVSTALKREENFKRHNDCLHDLQLTPVPSGDNVSISVGACPPAALIVLVQPHDPKIQPIYRFISWEDSTSQRLSSLVVKKAAAEELFSSFWLAQAGATIICRRQLDSGFLLIRIQYQNGQCIDQTVNTFTGNVIRTVPAPCDPHC